jgi:two-component system OmpR family sensor kinase
MRARARLQVKGGLREASALTPAWRWVGALPLRWRLALGYALVLLLALAPLTALQFVAVHALLFNNTSESLRAAVLADARAVSKPPRTGTGTIALSTGPGITAILVDATGRASVVATAQNEQTPAVSSLVRLPDITRALAGDPAAASTYQAATARGSYLVAVAVLPAGKGKAPPPVGASAAGSGHPDVTGAPSSRRVLALAESLASVDTTAAEVGLLTLGGAGVALLLATALGTLLVRRSLRPLTRVATAANAMAAGDYARRVAIPPASDEVGRLASSFNAMAAAVEDAFATQRRFVADAAHELRTPLTALGGYADVLLLGAASDPHDLAEALEAMRGETHRMTRLVNDLLALARLDNKQLTLHWTDVDLADILRDAWTGVRLLRPDREVTLDLSTPMVIVRGDADRLGQVVANLIDNAVKFTEPGGHIGLALQAEEGGAVLTVRDDGAGIAPEDLPRVRERFYRADEARSRATGGTGLGLSIVEAIVAAHGGSLDIVSQRGQGTTVTVRLPSVQAAPGAHLRSLSPATEEGSRPATHV